MELTNRYAVVPLALAVLKIELVLSLGTPWGLLRRNRGLITLALTALARALSHVHCRMLWCQPVNDAICPNRSHQAMRRSLPLQCSPENGRF